MTMHSGLGESKFEASSHPRATKISGRGGGPPSPIHSSGLPGHERKWKIPIGTFFKSPPRQAAQKLAKASCQQEQGHLKSRHAHIFLPLKAHRAAYILKNACIWLTHIFLVSITHFTRIAAAQSSRSTCKRNKKWGRVRRGERWVKKRLWTTKNRNASSCSVLLLPPCLPHRSVCPTSRTSLFFLVRLPARSEERKMKEYFFKPQAVMSRRKKMRHGPTDIL